MFVPAGHSDILLHTYMYISCTLLINLPTFLHQSIRIQGFLEQNQLKLSCALELVSWRVTSTLNSERMIDLNNSMC